VTPAIIRLHFLHYCAFKKKNNNKFPVCDQNKVFNLVVLKHNDFWNRVTVDNDLKRVLLNILRLRQKFNSAYYFLLILNLF
jgi:hypothetical protein